MKTALILALVLATAALAASAEDARAARALLGELVAADTSNPPGNESRAVAIGARHLAKAGIPFEITTFAPGRQNLVARLKGDGSARPLLLLAHVDVVGTAGQRWSTPPHSMKELGGYLQARGVGDDLGMAAVSLVLLERLKRERVPLKRDVIVAWTGDEESGGAGIRWLLANRKASIDAEVALNEGGGPVLDRSGKVVRLSLGCAEKTYQDFEVTAHGTTGHSSVPLDDNAILRLARALARLTFTSFPARLIPVTRAYFAARAALEAPPIAAAMRALAASTGPLPADALRVLEADPALRADLRTTVTPTLLTGGTRVNALPAEAHATLNARMLPDELPEQVRAHLVAVLADSKLEVKLIDDFGSAGPSPLEGPGPAAIRAVAARFYPGAPVIPTMGRGATDSRFLRHAGIAAYGMRPIATTEEDGRRAHGVDERIPADLAPGMEFYRALVLELAGRK